MNEKPLKANNKMEFQNILNAIKIFRDSGHLKSTAGCIADFFYSNHEQILTQLLKNNYNILSKVIDAGPYKKSETLSAYISTFTPIYFSRLSGKIKTNKHKPKEIEYYQHPLINFETFKILYKSKNDIDIKDIHNIRNEIISKENNTIWTISLSKHLKWPSTDAPLSLRRLLSDGWLTSGILSHYGYHVGNIGLGLAQRRLSLDSVLSEEFDSDLFDTNYISQWGEPRTVERLMKIAKTIAALCRNAKRSSLDYSLAITEWESDLNYLKTKYYAPFLSSPSEWPET